MTVAVPEPVPLDMPTGDPAAVDELVRDVAGAALWLALLSDRLVGPAASAPGWLGDDATAAATQVVRVAGLAREAADAVLGASGRLSAHGALLRDTRREIGALREEQDEDFRAVWQRLGQLEDPRLAVMSGASGWEGVVAEIEAAEAARRRRHALLLEELAIDVALTVRALADASRPVGGTGGTGDGERVLAHLAARLPGWGDPELARRGRALADALVRSSLTPEERASLAVEAGAFAGNPAFATALVRGLGEEGVGHLLLTLGQDPDGPAAPMARLLASALGAAVPGDGPHDGVAIALGASYVRPDDRYGSEARAAGMAVVLAVVGSPGPRTAMVGEWARQLLIREHARRGPVGLAGAGSGRAGGAGDPVGLAVGLLARSGDAQAAATLLGDDRVWAALLARFWGDGGAALDLLVATAARDLGPAGDQAVRAGLETIGGGTAAEDPTDWTVDRDVVAAVAPALGAAVADHVPVVASALTAAATGAIGEGTQHLLTGLGYLTVDRRAAAGVGAAVEEWSRTRSRDLAGNGPASPLPSVAVLSAYLAVQEYGQRLTYALDGLELQDDARNRALLWNWTVGPALDLIAFAPVRSVALAADLVNGYGRILVGMDGTFAQGKDRGLRFDADDAAGNALATLAPDRAAQASALRLQAEAAFRRAAATLGVPTPPQSPPVDWLAPLVDLATDGPPGMGEGGRRARGR